MITKSFRNFAKVFTKTYKNLIIGQSIKFNYERIAFAEGSLAELKQTALFEREPRRLGKVPLLTYSSRGPYLRTYSPYPPPSKSNPSAGLSRSLPPQALVVPYLIRSLTPQAFHPTPTPTPNPPVPRSPTSSPSPYAYPKATPSPTLTIRAGPQP